MQDISQKVLSDITIFNKYARYTPEKGRRESWEEIAERNLQMHLKKYPQLNGDISAVYRDFVIPKKVLPSMRSAQFAGTPIEINNARLFNCSYLPIDDYRAFSETCFLLLSGCGVGYSVQKHHVAKLPPIRQPYKTRKYLVEDSIIGWAEAVKVLCKAFFFGEKLPLFDLRDIRPKGSLLVTSGGKAPGPEPLHDMLHNIQKIFERKLDGEQLTTIECHSILCYIASAVLAGGIRRAAMIALFNINDDDMLTCKFGAWWEKNPHFALANNSVVLLRHKVKKEDFLTLLKKTEASKAGEPGIFFTHDKEIGVNPCGEISLSSNGDGGQFCNLTEINASLVETQEDLVAAAKAAAFIGTLQAGYTDFHYLRDGWKEQTEKEALLGISATGIASEHFLALDHEEAAKATVEENTRVAKIIGINKAARITTVKPSGTTSLVCGTSSGIHAWFAPFYVRRMRLNKEEPLYKYVKRHLPNLVEDDFLKPKQDAVLSIPQRAPEGAIYRSESALDLLERVKKIKQNWVVPGHRKGSNQHNVSVTVSVRDDEWDSVAEWMWENREIYNGISLLPYDGGSYIQAPFEEITEDKYNELYTYLKDIDLTKVKEDHDFTTPQQEPACSGGACEL
jgi:ribonucleoside-triphosphate reductase